MISFLRFLSIASSGSSPPLSLIPSSSLQSSTDSLAALPLYSSSLFVCCLHIKCSPCQARPQASQRWGQLRYVELGCVFATSSSSPSSLFDTIHHTEAAPGSSTIANDVLVAPVIPGTADRDNLVRNCWGLEGQQFSEHSDHVTFLLLSHTHTFIVHLFCKIREKILAQKERREAQKKLASVALLSAQADVDDVSTWLSKRLVVMISICLKMEGWEMGNGEWEMGNEDWGMGNGKWEMRIGEWGMGNGEWEMGMKRLGST